MYVVSLHVKKVGLLKLRTARALDNFDMLIQKVWRVGVHCLDNSSTNEAEQRDTVQALGFFTRIMPLASSSFVLFYYAYGFVTYI